MVATTHAGLPETSLHVIPRQNNRQSRFYCLDIIQRAAGEYET
jgi:hypothetical protein